MRVLVVTNTYPPSLNGVAISTYRTVVELRKQGHTVTVVMPKNTRRKNGHADDFELLSLPNPVQPDYPIPLNLSQSIVQRIQKKKYDIVHFHQPILVDRLARTIAKKQQIPLVFTYHTRYEDYVQKYFSFLPEQLLSKAVQNTVEHNIKRCDALIATTKTYQKWLKKIYQQPIYYVSTAGLQQSMKVNRSKNQLKKACRIPLRKTILLSVSRQAPEKNLELI
ncbi:MAG TPA: glycosyltransferase, partial [Patescibacteria group bacterium]